MAILVLMINFGFSYAEDPANNKLTFIVGWYRRFKGKNCHWFV